MKSFTEVVVPLDLLGPCDVVLGVASTIARRAGVGVRLITVSSPLLDHRVDEQDLAALAATMSVPSVTWAVVESNDIARAILDDAGDAAVICLETRVRGPLAALVLGSTTTDVLLAADHPVLLVGPETAADGPWDVLEVCIDRPDAASALLPVVTSWAGELGLPLRLVHGIAAGEEPLGPDDRASLILAELAREARDDGGVAAEIDVLVGRAVPELLVEDAIRHRAGIVAVGLRRRSRLRHRALGSVALAVARSVRAPVLAVPVGSTTPG